MNRCQLIFPALKKFSKSLGTNNIFKKMNLRSLTTLNKNYSHFVNLNRLYFGPSYTQRYNFRKTQQSIVLSGILTFLGLQKPTPEERESELITTMKRGILLIQREEFVKAEQILHLALKIAQEQNDEEGITYVYDLLANLAFETKQFQKAETLFVETMKMLLAKGEDSSSNKVTHISLKLAKIYESRQEYEKAELGYKFCIDNLSNKLQTEDEDTLALWGMTMDWYGKYLLTINKKNDALDCLKKAYDICVKVNGTEHEQTVVLLNDLGTVSSLTGDTDSAMHYFEKAKDIGKNLPEMKDLASIYINLGQLYLLREMYDESKTSCMKGLKLAQKNEDEVGIFEAKQCLNNIKELLNRSSSIKEPKETDTT